MTPYLNGDLNNHAERIAHHGVEDKEPIAIIGLAMRAADEATDSEAFWHFLLRARQATRPIPEDRLSSKAFYHPDPDHGGTFYAQGACFLGESPNGFDAAFFKMSKTEVQSLDPQQRILMENVYHALENAGLPMEDVVSSNTSVFVNGFNYHHADRLNSDLEQSFKHKPTGAESSMISGRVSWFYNLQGASLTVDTACSSSLVALHLARQSLLAKESEMAIVSGVSVIGYPAHLMKMSHSGLLGPEGKSMAFDSRAEGYGLGEGVGTIILKPLSAAVRDGDTIRALVRGTGLGHDGRTPGMTYPSATAQESLIRQTYRASGLDLKDTLYSESHGTGTQAGDFIECTAIAAAFETQQRDSPFYVGAVKPNIGHLEGGAGIASVIKSVLILESGVIPPNATLEDINPKISQAWNLQFPTSCIPWPTSGIRRSSISAYGISGTNGHCILDDAYHYLKERQITARHTTRVSVPSDEEIKALLAQISKRYDHQQNESISETLVPRANGTRINSVNGINGANGPHGLNGANVVNGASDTHRTNGVIHVDGISGLHGANGAKINHLSPNETSLEACEAPILFILSAFDQNRMENVVKQTKDYISSHIRNFESSSWQALNDLAFSLSEKRSRLPWKGYALCNSVDELQEKLPNLPSNAIKSRSSLRIGFVFTGQGAQYAKMGQQLLIYPVFRQSLEAAGSYFKSLGSDWSLLEELSRDAKHSRISKSAFAHPLSCAVQIALLDLLLSWGVIPHRVTGHSSGEIAAAYCAGKISREAAWKVAYFRGHVLRPGASKSSFTGGMIAVGLEEEPLLHHLKKLHARFPRGALSIACYNSPRNHTVSGDLIMVDALKELLDEQGIFTRKLKVEHAAHSAHMEYFSSEYDELLGDLPSKHRLNFDHTMHMFSTLTGRLLDDTCAPGKSSHWRDSMVCPVKFTEALSSMCFDPTPEDGSSTHRTWVDVILEVGPHPAMQSAAKEIVGSNADIPYFATLNRKDDGLSSLLETIGNLVICGAPINLDKVNRAANPSVSPRMIVDLPPYPFNHEEQTLYESRLVKNTRLRQFPRHDLFGAPVSDWNPNSPRWRHFLRISENPWLKEHVIGDNCVFPGAGYIVMAVEAMQQVTDDSDIIGVHLREILFKAMLIVPDDTQGVEVCLSFYPVPDSKTSFSTTWRRFEVASYNQATEEWVEHCTGEISPNFKKSLNVIDGSREEETARSEWLAFVQVRENRCQAPLDLAPIYRHLRDIGINHGDIFRCLSNVAIGDENQGMMTGDIIVPDIKQVMPKQYAHEHLIHPTTLDNAFQAVFAAMYDLNGKQALRRGCIPSSVREMWLSTKELSSDPGTTFRCTSQASPSLHGSFECAIQAWNPSNPSAKAFSLTGARLAPFKSESSDAPASDRRACYSIEWHPDLNFITNNDLQELLPRLTSTPANYANQLEWLSKLQLASTLLANESLLAIRGAKASSLGDQHMPYLRLLRSIAADLTIDAVPYVPLETWLRYSSNATLKKALYREVEARNPEGALLIKMASKISSILRNEITMKKLLTETDDLIWSWDKSSLSRGNILPTLTQFLTLLRHSHRSVRILDVQGRSGALSEHVLKILSGDDNAEFIEQYVVGSPSTSDFEALMKRLAVWENVVENKALDLGDDLLKQGFEAKSFDLIIVNDCVRAMPDMEATFSRLNALIRPGGRLCILEEMRPESLHTNVSFGFVPSFSRAIENKIGTFARKSDWNKALQRAGFSGIDFEASSSTYAEFADFTMMVSTAKHAQPETIVGSLEVLVILQSHSDISRLLTGKLIDAGVKHSICQLDMLRPEDFVGRTCISLLEAKEPILNNLDSGTFQAVRELVTASDSLLWVTGDPLIKPEYQMVTGLIRTVRWELDRNNLNLVTLSLDGEATATAVDNVDAIFRVFQHQYLRHGVDPGGSNAEYRVRRRVIETNHLVRDKSASTALQTQFERPKPILQQWDAIERPVRLVNPQPGVDSLVWTTDEDLSRQPLTAHEIEIDVRAVGLNFKDLLVAMGEIDQPGFGHEAAGIVVTVGSSVTNLKAGDRVMCLGDPSQGRMGTLRTRVRTHSGLAIKIPNTLSFEIAAGLPIIYSTVIYSLGHIARLRAGEKILIHAAAGGVGQAAIQYAQVKGAEIFVTLSSIEKKQFIIDNFNIPEDHIFSSRDLTFSSGIKQIAPAGVDVVLNSLSGEALRQSWACIAPFGRFVEIGKLDFQNGSRLDMTPFLHNATFSGVDLNALAEERPEICQDILQEVMQLWLGEKIHEARPTQVSEYGQLKEGMRLLQTGKSIGKMTLVPGSHPVSVLPKQLPPLELDSNASYILAGGLGGIGRSIALKLARMGAKHLIFLSRSATVHEAGQNTIDKLEALGCTSHVFQCDVSDDDRLHEVFASINQTLPPVKGCIQCCFVLRDGAFDSMSHQDWGNRADSKDVDFFLMLSSITGIVGNRSQANYNAGNNFQDALARHRVSKGMRGASVNLGAVVGIGFVAENSEYAGKHTFKMANQQTEEEVLAVVEYMIDQRHITTPSPDSAQLVCGLRTPTSYSLGNEEPPSHLQYPMFCQLPAAPKNALAAHGAEAGKSAPLIRDQLQAATIQDDAAQIIHKALRHKMASLLNVSEDSFDDSLSVRENGVDSLIEMEFRTWFAKELGAAVPLKDLAKDLKQLSARLVLLSSFSKFH